MNKPLFIYSTDQIANLYDELENYKFITLTSILRRCNQVNRVCLLELDYYAVDLTTFFSDVRNERWHKGIIEDYIEEIDDSFENVVFLLNKNEIEVFNQIYPFLFSSENIKHCYSVVKTSEVISDTKKSVTPLFVDKDLLIYSEVDEIQTCIRDRNFISISQLIRDFNGISANINIDILENDIEYLVDLTTLIDYLRLRKDQLFIYEIIIYELVKNKSVDFTIKESHFLYLRELFPFVFKRSIKCNEKTNELELESIKVDINTLTYVKSVTAELLKRLQGHRGFLEAFTLNHFKFRVLNQVGKRKIFSIFICGKSGIGKTEFARLISEIMYPDEAQIKLNFGNYSTEGVLNSLIGSPLGYVGSENGGELINKVKDSESKIILIDEFEKADSKVFNFFYELLEDGQFTDRAGNVHDLNGYIIIFTSNLNIKNYNKYIPEPLDSRFDMKYEFNPLTDEEKLSFINSYTAKLIKELEENLRIDSFKLTFEEDLNNLVECDNLREIRRKIEDIVLENVMLNFS